MGLSEVLKEAKIIPLKYIFLQNEQKSHNNKLLFKNVYMWFLLKHDFHLYVNIFFGESYWFTTLSYFN